MPVRQFLQRLALFGFCLPIIGVAWACGVELSFVLPSRRQHHHIQRPPTHPGLILAFFGLGAALTVLLRQYGLWFLVATTLGMLFGSAVGLFVFNWTPTWAQHCLSLGMLSVTICAWSLRYYLDE